MKQTHSEADVRKLIRELVRELAPNPETLLLDNPRLVDDLLYNSLTLLELAFTIEDEFHLPPIDRAAAQHIVTARDIEDYVVLQLESIQQGALATAAAS